ncbi:MAG: acetate kinase [Leptospiraceae bacterium]|nr:acetate kinase [Leptospiraceae bacterium]MDW8305900.1 acetate kinase [Leptospiraceae bacterium]
MKKILVINCGSSTIKAGVFASDSSLLALAQATIELAREEKGFTLRRCGELFYRENIAINSIQEGIFYLKQKLEELELLQKDDIVGVGHRVVHGGGFFDRAVLINKEVLEAIDKASLFAPLHNPANLEGIKLCQRLFPVPQVAVFDTAFHHSMPNYVYTYGLPRQLIEKYRLRRYGFHGISHAYVAEQAALKLKKTLAQFSGITLHLGSGASMCAIKEGKSVDTTMGLTPLEGLVMATRSGDIDPALVAFLQEKEGLSAQAVMEILNKKSGLLGLCGQKDMRLLLKEAEAQNQEAILALDVFVYRIRKYLGAYFFILPQVDALVFTGGIGENAPLIRQKVLVGLERFGIFLNNELNKTALGKEALISEENSPIKVYVIPTDEEKRIALEVQRLCGGFSPESA